jgi:hypothetical protein
MLYESDDTYKPFLLCHFIVSTESICFAPLVFIPWGYKAGLVTPAQPTSFCMISLYCSTSFPMAENRSNRDRSKEDKRGFFSLQGDHSSFLRFHGRARVAHVRDHTRAPTKSSKSRVYDSGGISNCRVPADPSLPTPGAGYVVACSVFYEQGFGTPPH